MANYIIWIILGYIIGSIPWGLIIGKVFFNKDIRNYGSGNLGGTNAGRVLGAPIGILVILLDALKAFLLMIVCNKFAPEVISYCGLAVCIGHCFPIFAQFRGGKAVACSYGYFLALAIFVTHNILTFIIPVLTFFIVLIISRWVSLGSMLGVTSASLYLLFANTKIGFLVLLLSLFVIYRHSSNIKNIINGNEPKLGKKHE